MLGGVATHLSEDSCPYECVWCNVHAVEGMGWEGKVCGVVCVVGVESLSCCLAPLIRPFPMHSTKVRIFHTLQLSDKIHEQ